LDDASADAVHLRGKVRVWLALSDKKENGRLTRVVEARADAERLDFGMSHQLGRVEVADGGSARDGIGRGRDLLEYQSRGHRCLRPWQAACRNKMRGGSADEDRLHGRVRRIGERGEHIRNGIADGV